MKSRTLCLAASLALAIVLPFESASAVTGASAASLAQPRIHGLVVKESPSRPSSRQPATRAPRPFRDGITRSRSGGTARIDRRQVLRAVALEDRARQHEQAQVEARAQRIYAASQVSAPILLDTRACKRIGAHGESIYENCALTAANVPSR